MSTELLANSPTPGSAVAIATLAVAVNTTPAAGTVETWTFSSAPPAALQATGQYRFTVDSEICIDVTGGSGASRQIQRGAEGSTVATHLQGASIFHGLTAGGLLNYVATNLPASVPSVSSANTFAANQTVAASANSGPLLLVDNSASVYTGKTISTSNYAGSFGASMVTDWSANTTGQTGYDSVDVVHRSSGDTFFSNHFGGVVQAQLATGTVAANNGILWLQYPSISGTAGNAVQVALVVAGNNTPLTVTAAASVVTVNVATDSSGNATSTAAQVIAAANALGANVFTRALPLADATGESSGAGVVGAVALTNLSGGFTGTSHGCACFRGSIPYWLDADANMNGTIVNTRSGHTGFALTNLAKYAYSYSINLTHASRAPCILINNASAGTYSSPVANTGVAMVINDSSVVASFHINRLAAPAASSPSSPVSSFGAVFSIKSTAGVFPVLIAQPQTTGTRPDGLWLNNDGKASFGRAGQPDTGVVLIESNAVGGAASVLQLSNSDGTSSAGVRVNCYAGGNLHAQITSQYISTRSSLFIAAANSGVMTQYASFNNGAYALILNNTSASSADGVLRLKNSSAGSGNGATLDVQVGSTPATLWQIDSNGNLNVSGAAGLKIGTAITQKLGFWNAAPVVQQLLATGASHTVDDVITLLQTLGLCKQS